MPSAVATSWKFLGDSSMSRSILILAGFANRRRAASSCSFSSFDFCSSPSMWLISTDMATPIYKCAAPSLKKKVAAIPSGKK